MSKNYIQFFCGVQPNFVFLATCAAEKLLISENRFNSGFQEYVGGIDGSGVQSENLKIFGERHSRQEGVDFIDTLKPPVLSRWF